MHPDLLESLVRDRITELRGVRSQRSVSAGPGRLRRSRRRAATGRARVGRLFVRVGTSLIGEGVGRAERQPARTEPVGSTR
jgi:hypothetical protein